MNTQRLRGRVVERADVFLDDPRQGTRTLCLKADVQPRVDVLPAPGIVIPFVRGKPGVGEVTLVNLDDVPLRPSLAAPQPEGVRATIRVVEEGRRYVLAVEPAPGARSAGISTLITVATGNPRLPEITLPVILDTHAPVRAYPGTLELGRIPIRPGPGAPGLERLILVRADADSFRVLGASSDLPFLRVSVVQPAPGDRSCEISVCVRPELLRPGRFAGRIRIRTTHRDCPTLEVPVTGGVF
ncbi:MAG TPA: hypothetical protein VMS93_02870 [Candidatus Saccharimonadales bacterium]|nr:hypothetical protein [Candidatus Saccharimonadales bacterium]